MKFWIIPCTLFFILNCSTSSDYEPKKIKTEPPNEIHLELDCSIALIVGWGSIYRCTINNLYDYPFLEDTITVGIASANIHNFEEPINFIRDTTGQELYRSTPMDGFVDQHNQVWLIQNKKR